MTEEWHTDRNWIGVPLFHLFPEKKKKIYILGEKHQFTMRSAEHKQRGSCLLQNAALGKKATSAKLFTPVMEEPWEGGLTVAVAAVGCLAWARGHGELFAKAPFHTPFPLLTAQEQQKWWPDASRPCFPCLSPQLCCGRSNLSPDRSNSICSQQFNPACTTKKSWASFRGWTGGKYKWEHNIGLFSFRPAISMQLLKKLAKSN